MEWLNTEVENLKSGSPGDDRNEVEKMLYMSKKQVEALEKDVETITNEKH